MPETDPMDNLPWVQEDSLIRWHDKIIEKTGGLRGIRDKGALDSALNRPKNTYAFGGDSIDICDLAAEYGFGIACNHAFADGNKRTAIFAMKWFLEDCGFMLIASEDEQFNIMIDIANNSKNVKHLAAWVRLNLRKKTNLS